jgi:hypothetical protein
MQPPERAPWLITLSLAFLVGACAATPASPTPGPTASISPIATSPQPSSSAVGPTESTGASASATLIPTRSPTEVVSPSPTVAPTAESGSLPIKWVNPPGASGLDGLSDLRGYADASGKFVIVGSQNVLDPEPNPDRETHDEAAIWWSATGTSWQQAQLPNGYAALGFTSAVTRTNVGPAFVAVGRGVPLWSADGTIWNQGTGTVSTNVSFTAVGSTADGVVALGYDFTINQAVAIQSADGKAWVPADTIAELLGTSPVIFINGDNLMALVPKSTIKTVVYEVATVGSWQKVGVIGDVIDKAAVGPKGWLAVGRYAWVSSDARTWSQAPMTPILPLGSAQAVIADAAGFVVATNVYPPGCVIEDSEIAGYTWTSVDGLRWDQMKLSWKGRWLDAFFVINRTLVGVGQSHDMSQGDLPFGFVRTADLPAVPPAAVPTPTPVPTPTTPPGCGGP